MPVLRHPSCPERIYSSSRVFDVLALSMYPVSAGIAIAARIARITSTTITSIIVKPQENITFIE
jgi:hypothetical protein